MRVMRLVCIFYRGLLSGKIKRGMTSAPEGSRIAWSSSRGTGGNPVNPAWEMFSENEQVWDVIDKVAQIADNKGKLLNTFIITSKLKLTHFPYN